MSDADEIFDDLDLAEYLETAAQAERSVVIASGKLRFDQGVALAVHANVDPYAALALLR